MSSKQQRVTSLITFLALLGLVGTLVFLMVKSYLLAVFLGGVVAILLAPLHRKLLRRGWRPRVSAGLLTIGAILVLFGPLLLLTHHVASQGSDFLGRVTRKDVREFNDQIATLWQNLPFVETIAPLREAVESRAFDAVDSITRAVTDGLLRLAADLPDAALQIFLGACACFFLLIDASQLLAWLQERLPLDRDVQRAIADWFMTSTVRVIWSNVAAAGTQAALLGAGFVALGLPGALLAAFVTFFLAFIPIIGTAPVWITAILYLVSQALYAKAALMLVVGVIVASADNFVRPWVLAGQKAGMHPLVTLIATFGGIQMFGIVGVVVGPLLASLLTCLLALWPIMAARLGIRGASDGKPGMVGAKPLLR
jgi:predicted PurR-regulated permease PerM